MPVVSIPLEDTNRTILNDVYFKIVRDINNHIKIPNSSIVVMHKDIETTLTDNSTNATLNTKPNLPSTVSKRKVLVNITEDYNEDALATTSTHEVGAFPIFVDNDINVFVYPIYVKSDINIEFNYFTNSKTEATRIRDDIRVRLSQARNILAHDVEYNILIPDVVEDFIVDVYELKNRLVPSTLEDYFREHTTKRIHVLTDMANKENAKIAVYEKQIRIIGVFDFSPLPEKIEANNDDGNYKISFNYKLSLNIPRSMVMRYPVMICNRPLPAKYLQFIEDGKVNSTEEYRRDLNYNTFSMYNLGYFEAHRFLQHKVDINLPMNIPLFDEFNERVGHTGYAIIVSFLTDINETDKKSLFNLTQIDPYYIPDELLDFIRNVERPYVTKLFRSFLFFGLWQDDRHYDNDILEIDANLNIKSTKELSLFKPTRVTISFILDISLLPEEAIERLIARRNILLLFIREYVNVYRNYKPEWSRLNVAENSFYRTLILLLNRFIGLDDLDTIANILRIIKQEALLYLNVISIIYNNYPNMYHYLQSHNLVSTADFKPYLNKNRGYYGMEIVAPKTVFESSIVALRREE